MHAHKCMGCRRGILDSIHDADRLTSTMQAVKMEVTPVPEPGALLLAHPLERFARDACLHAIPLAPLGQCT